MLNSFNVWVKTRSETETETAEQMFKTGREPVSRCCQGEVVEFFISPITQSGQSWAQDQRQLHCLRKLSPGQLKQAVQDSFKWQRETWKTCRAYSPSRKEHLLRPARDQLRPSTAAGGRCTSNMETKPSDSVVHKKRDVKSEQSVPTNQRIGASAPVPSQTALLWESCGYCSERW